VSNIITIPHKFEPRIYQKELLASLDSGCKRAVAVYHRRAGKDKTLFNIIIKKAVERVGIYYYFFPEFSQGRRVIWDGVDGSGMPFLDHIPGELLSQANKTEMKLALSNGSIIQIIGTDKIDKVRGSNPVGCVFSEYAFQNPAAWDVVRPILGENSGWAAFNSTPNGKNFFYDMTEMAKKNDDWFCQVVTVEDSVDENGVRYVPQKVVDDERAAGMSEEMIQQEFYCSFTANAQGYYYLEYLEKIEEEDRRGSVPHYPDLPVSTFWDIGVGDSTAIWFVQIVSREYHLIDYFEDNGKGLEYYVRMLQGKPYIYDTHTFPHDFGHTEFGTGRSRIETAQKLIKSGRLNVLPKLPIDDGISAARMVLPKCFFDKKKTEIGFKALQNYHREFDKKHQEYKQKPVHDWSSHAADAFRYFALGVTTPRSPKSRLSQRVNKYKNIQSNSWMKA